jgi:type IV secretory pathway VirB6-like protein
MDKKVVLIRDKLLAYLLIMLLTAACTGDYYCITNDPAQDLNPNSTIVSNTQSTINNINPVNGPVVTYNSYVSNNDILIKVSGTLNLCSNDMNKQQTNCNCPTTLPNSCVPSADNCQCTLYDPNCNFGNRYQISAKTSSWTTVQKSAIEGQTIQMTVPQSNYGGPVSSNCPLGKACSSNSDCGPPPSTEYYANSIGCIGGFCDSPRPCPNLTCNLPPPFQPINGQQPPPIPAAQCQTPCQQDCSGYALGNRWSSDNFNNIQFYNSASYPMSYPSSPPLNACSVNNSGQMNIGLKCWNVGAMGLVFQVTDPNGPNNINGTSEDWQQSQTFVSGGVDTDGSLACPVPTTSSNIGSYLTQVCFSPSPNEKGESSYAGSTDPNRITTQTIVINDPSQSTVSLRVYDTYYSDNLGGYSVYVLSTCNVSNGQPLNLSGIGQLQLQVAGSAVTLPKPIASCDDLANTSFSGSQYCSPSDLQNKKAVYYHITQNLTGQMKYQINSSGGGITLGQSDVTGALNITTYSQGQVGAFSLMIQDAITMIQHALYGVPSADPPTKGVIETIWNNMVGEQPYKEYLRALLTLYIIFYGILFLLGTVEISQMDLIVRVIKIGVIVALTSDQSWKFFSDNLFNLFLYGSGDLIGLFSISGGGSDLDHGNNNVFSFVDNVFQVLFFDYRTWFRILALLLTSPLGFIYVLLILWGTLNYFLAIIEAVITYIMSILTVSILLVLAPIFIPFILFSITRELFNRWIQFLFAFAIKPVILLIGLNILSTMLLIVILKLFSFPVCFGCAFPIFLNGFADIVSAINKVVSIGDFFFCLPWFKPWGFSNIGDGSSFSSATGISISGILLFVMLTTFMKKLPKFVDDMTTRLSGTRSIALKVGGGPNVASAMMGTIGDKALGIVGMDSASRQRRKGVNTNMGPSDPKDRVGVQVNEKK